MTDENAQPGRTCRVGDMVDVVSGWARHRGPGRVEDVADKSPALLVRHTEDERLRSWVAPSEIRPVAPRVGDTVRVDSPGEYGHDRVALVRWAGRGLLALALLDELPGAVPWRCRVDEVRVITARPAVKRPQAKADASRLWTRYAATDFITPPPVEIREPMEAYIYQIKPPAYVPGRVVAPEPPDVLAIAEAHMRKQGFPPGAATNSSALNDLCALAGDPWGEGGGRWVTNPKPAPGTLAYGGGAWWYASADGDWWWQYGGRDVAVLAGHDTDGDRVFIVHTPEVEHPDLPRIEREVWLVEPGEGDGVPVGDVLSMWGDDDG